MTTKQNVMTGGKSPFKKVRAGSFQISCWRFPTLRMDRIGSDYSFDRWVDIYRARVEYNFWDRTKGQWIRQGFWCPLDSLRDLAQAVDGLNEADGFSPDPEEKANAR